MTCLGCGGTGRYTTLDGVKVECALCGGIGNRAEFLSRTTMIQHEEASRIPDFLLSLEKMKEVHIKKNQDYAAEDNPFSNFDVQEYISSLFKKDRDKVFANMVAVKLARLATLLNSGSIPNNESIEDTFIDQANYTLLWKADYVRRLANRNIPNP